MKTPPRFRAAHAPSPDVRYGSGLPMPRRRTFATVQGCPRPVAGRSLRHPASAHSMLTTLRHPACACQQRRLSGRGQPLTDTSYPTAPGPEGRVSTSRRRSAKRKWQDAMFRVNTVHGQPLTDTSYPTAPGPEGRVSTSRRRSAKRKWQDAMFRVNTAHGQPLTDAACGLAINRLSSHATA